MLDLTFLEDDKLLEMISDKAAEIGDWSIWTADMFEGNRDIEVYYTMYDEAESRGLFERNFVC